MPLGAIIGALGSLIGGSMSSNAQKKAAQMNIDLQKEFAQQGIRWKVEDAKAAGIHPLAALGANTIGFSPVSIGDGGGAAIANAGHNIGRAVDAMRTPSERVDAYTGALRALQLQRGQLENTLLASRIRLINQPGSPPGIPALDQDKQPQRTTSMGTPGGRLFTDPNVSDAQTIQDRYGDIAENVYGIWSWMNEALPQHRTQILRRLQDDLSRIRSRYAPDSRVRGPR